MAIGTQFATNLVRDHLQFKPSSEENSARLKDHHQCPKCKKEFGHYQILLLHLRVHESGENSLSNASPKHGPQAGTNNCDGDKKVLHEAANNGETKSAPSAFPQNHTRNVSHMADTVNNNGRRSGQMVKPHRVSGGYVADPYCVRGIRMSEMQRMEAGVVPLLPLSSAKKLPGLTKIRLEDCLRCDECSCIYIDKNDYMKHMKNFHNSSPKKQKQKKGCRSCCRHCNCKSSKDLQHKVEKERGKKNLLHHNIKDRWSKILSQRNSPNDVAVKIKQEPEYDPDDPDEMTDYSHLLSQVEVKIKTEPPEDQEYMYN